MKRIIRAALFTTIFTLLSLTSHCIMRINLYSHLKYLPESVEDLKISTVKVDLYGWIAQIGIGKILQLAERMSKLRRASLQYTPETRHGNNGEPKMRTFFKILNAFKDGKKAPYAASFSDFFSRHNSMIFLWRSLYDDGGEERAFKLSASDIAASEVILNSRFLLRVIDIELALKLLEYSCEKKERGTVI
ncbi:hypothetical protein BDF21DRAFT_450972 [Thamnidium elegans]|nr:hypothetical protein BDF21DRAFT_450972 [Thamnidium elegans]